MAWRTSRADAPLQGAALWHKVRLRLPLSGVLLPLGEVNIQGTYLPGAPEGSMYEKEAGWGVTVYLQGAPHRPAAPRGVGAWPQEINGHIGRQLYQDMPSHWRTRQDGRHDGDDYIRELTENMLSWDVQNTLWGRKVITVLKIRTLRHKGLSSLPKTRQPVGRTARPGSRLQPKPMPCPLQVLSWLPPSCKE